MATETAVEVITEAIGTARGVTQAGTVDMARGETGMVAAATETGLGAAGVAG